MRAHKVTPPKRARVRQVALLKVQVPAIKELARELGLAPAYTRHLVSVEVERIKQEKWTELNTGPLEPEKAP